MRDTGAPPIGEGNDPHHVNKPNQTKPLDEYVAVHLHVNLETDELGGEGFHVNVASPFVQPRPFYPRQKLEAPAKD